MNAQYKKGVLELCVLKLIQQDDLYGYETVQKVSFYIEVTESTIYPLLRRLTKEGYSVQRLLKGVWLINECS